MQDPRRARLSAGLGIASMVLSTSGCVSCGVGYLLAIPLGVLGFVIGRGVSVRRDAEGVPEDATHAWAQVGAWTSALGGGFGILITLMALVWLVLWGLGITTAAAL